MSVVGMAGSRPKTTAERMRRRVNRVILYIFLTLLAIVFLWPLFYAVYMSLRPFAPSMEAASRSVLSTLFRPAR